MATFTMLVAFLITLLFGSAAAQTVTVTVNTCAASTVTVTATAPALTPCSIGYSPVVNGNFESGVLTPWSNPSSGDVRIASNCGFQGTAAAPGKCASLKPIGNGQATISQSSANFCPGKTYKVTFNIGLSKTVLAGLASGTRLPTFTLDFAGQTWRNPVCATSVGSTNPCTSTDVTGNYVFRSVQWTSTAVPGANNGLSITISDTLVSNAAVFIDTVVAAVI